MKTQVWMRTASIWLGLFIFLIYPISFIGLIFSFLIYSIFRLINTVGYHRYFSHNAFKCSKLWEWIFGILGCISLQNSPIKWAIIHINHHKYSDTLKDPYLKSIKYFFKLKKSKIEYIPIKYIRLLKNNKFHQFLDNNSFLISISYGIFLAILSIDFFVYGYILPICLFVISDGLHNMFAHNKTNALNRWYLEIFIPTLGEWWHKNHHEQKENLKFSNFDIGYWFIRLIQK